jgi:TonB-dependent receptor
VEDAFLEGTDVLPALNVTWNMSKRQNLRVAWSRTLARPQLRELSPFDMFNYEYFYTEVGNPELQYAHLTHYDLRWEMYPSPREFVSIGFFHKKMDRPIQTLLTVRVTQEALTPVNGDNGELTGAEFELRAGMGRFWQVFGAQQPLWLRNWGISANYSRVQSLVRYGTTEIPLTGQSTYSVNAGIFYGTQRFHSNLMYKAAGKRLHAFTAGVLPDVYAYPMQNLDFTFGASVSSKTVLKFQFENILNEPMTFKQGDLVVRRWLPGRTISLSMRYSI